MIEKLARISHRSESGQTEDSWQRFIEAVVVGHGDWSVCEHQSATVLFRVDRGVMAEMTRHRHFSYTVESSRFVNHAKRGGDLEFIKPSDLPEECDWSFQQSASNSEREYLQMLVDGAKPQQARAALTQAFATTVGMTGNLRAWRYFFMARTTKESHPDFVRVTDPLLAAFQHRIPLLYDDIKPLQKQSISMAKAH